MSRTLLFDIGDEVWYAFKDESFAPNGYFDRQKIKEIRITECGVTYITNSKSRFSPEDVGKVFFRSYEEAKEKLNKKEEEIIHEL